MIRALGLTESLRDSVWRRYADGAFDPVEASQGLDQSRSQHLNNDDDLPFRSRNALPVAEEFFATTQTR